MRKIYEAANAVEAHMIADMLKQEGVEAHVHGQHLQGAIGELPAAGFISVQVDEADYVQAREFIQRWEAKHPADETPPTPATRSRLLAGLAWGCLIGIAVTYVFFRAPVTLDGIDHDGDGLLDEKWFYSPGGRLAKIEMDRNRDGKIDFVGETDKTGVLVSAESDDDFNGSFESRLTYREGNVAKSDVDSDGDGFSDFRSFYRSGVMTSTEYIHPNTGYPLRVEHFRLGKLEYAEIDSNGDQTLETRLNYSPLGEVVSREAIAADRKP